MRAYEKGDLPQQIRMYRELVGLAVDAILTGDAGGNFISANKSAVELTGYSVEEMVGMNMSDFFSAEELANSPLRYDLLRQGQTAVNERLLTRKDGSNVPVEMKSRMLADGSYHSFIRDISERRAAEKALRLSEEKFSRAFRLSPDAINITRLKDGKILDVNDGFTKLIGWSRKEVLGHSALPGDLNIWCDEQERRQLVGSLQKQGKVIGARVHLRHKSGYPGIGLMSARVLEIDGEPCIIAITRDITEQEALKEERVKLEAQMLQAQKLESLGVLAGGIAHDFNNILMAVLGHCELAQRKLPAESPARRNLEQINAAVNKAADLASQMLAYSGKGQFVIEPCDLSHLVEEMQQMLAVSVTKKVKLIYDLMSNLPCIKGDMTQLRQIVLNLVVNASDAMEKSSGVIKVATSVRRLEAGELLMTVSETPLSAGEYVDLEVADNGCGMNEEVQVRIFDPFFTTKFAGRGLGMAAVIGIVRGHAGGLMVHSAPGEGTRINVLLPSTHAVAAPLSKTSGDQNWSGSGLVLLVDDDPAVLDIGEQMLQELGFDVLTAKDGEEALLIFARMTVPPLFALIDLTMPGLSGEETFMKLRELNPNLPVIISSGYNEQEVSSGFMQHHSVGFLKKPYEMSGLQQSVQNLLAHCTSPSADS